MTKLLDEAIERVRTLPQQAQGDLARIVLQLTDAEQSIYALSADERASIERSLAQAELGNYAPDEHVAAVWAKHGQ